MSIHSGPLSEVGLVSRGTTNNASWELDLLKYFLKGEKEWLDAATETLPSMFSLQNREKQSRGSKKKNPKQTPSALHTCDLGDSPEQVNSAWVDYQRHAKPQG